MSKKKPLIIITGPTAAGKTELSLSLAEKIGGEIISADSMQVYKTMDIGTAKIMPHEMRGIKHHLIDILEPEEPFNVALFQKLAKEACEKIYSQGKIPIMVGGTGFYIQSLLYDISFSEEPENNIRTELEALAEQPGGAEKLWEELCRIDIESSKIIHKNNVKKIIRAIEFYRLNNKPISEHNVEEHQKESQYNSLYFVLTMDRAKLYDRINRRVDIMVNAGLYDEVKALYEKGLDESYTSMQGIGYKEMLGAVKNEYSVETAVDMIKQNTRHFAKRQLTWFRREKDVIWVDKDEYDSEEAILGFMMEQAEKAGFGK